MLLKLNDDAFKDSNIQQSFLMLFNDINEDSAKECCSWIMDANFQGKNRPEVLNLMIMSHGGELASGFSIIDCIRGSSIPVRTIAIGCVASAGLMISMAGQKGFRVVTPNTSIMSHQFSGGFASKSHELVAAVREFDLTANRMMNHYKKCTGLKEKDIKKYLLPPQDVYLTADEAVKLGLADIVSDLS